MFTRFLRASIVGAGLALMSVMTAQAEDFRPRAVVELFTSQGCSSCPPADRILADFAGEGDLLALSWHVDYWNYLGWKDTFSKAAFTERQRRYAVSLGRRQIYTPQAIVNGRDHAVGSSRPKIETLIRTYSRSGKGLSVPIDTKRTGDADRVTIASSEAAHDDATLWMVYFDRKGRVKIKRGENRGRTITYHNVVRETQMLGMLKGGSFTVDLPVAELKRIGHDACALILQQSTRAGTPGPILGATIIGDFGT